MIIPTKCYFNFNGITIYFFTISFSENSVVPETKFEWVVCDIITKFNNIYYITTSLKLLFSLVVARALF